MSENEPKEEQNIDIESLYNTHVEACKIFFDPTRLEKEYEARETTESELNKRFKTKVVYDITGLSAIKVIAVITSIINDGSKWPTIGSTKTFYFFIKCKEKEVAYRIFKLLAQPSDKQPGNGFVNVLRLANEKCCVKGLHKYDTINKALANTLPSPFAEVIKKLFKDNSEIAQLENAVAEKKEGITEVYFLLLFEIARRLSNEKDKTQEGKALDDLPIGSAIAKKIKTLAAKSETTGLEAELTSLSHCFKFGSKDRKKSLQQLLQSDAAGRHTTPRSCKNELEHMFCGSSVVEDLSLDEKLSLDDTDDSAVEEKPIPSAKSPTQLQQVTMRLQKERNLRPHNVKGDGNCFFRAVSHQIYGTEDKHGEIRKAGIRHIQMFPQNFIGPIEAEGKTLDDYIGQMSQDSTPCDHIMVQAVACATNSVIHVIHPTKTYDVHLCPPNEPKETVVGYINGDHYVSVDVIDEKEKN